MIIGGSDLQTTLTTIIDDCGNQIHFSEHFFKNHLTTLQDDVTRAMNELDKIIDDKFKNSINAIDITGTGMLSTGMLSTEC